MKPILKLISFLLITYQLNAQQWTWMKGSDTLTQPGKYGTIGVPSPTNNPGSRHGAATWVDSNGDLWLFGGEGVTTNTVLCWMNDMWKYTVSTGEWTWVRGSNLPNQNGIYGTKGVPSTTNQPGAREFMNYWTDAAGNFWMFGGDGFPETGSISMLNDLWRYNPTTNQWTWMNGAKITDDPGTYGTKGIPAPSNTPGARHGGGTAVDASGNLWLFAGYGHATTASSGNLNDLWKYTIATNEWTWMSGTNQINQFGSYGTLSTPSPTNIPGGREFPALWADKNGNIWLFGGGGFATSASPQGHLNDLWRFKISNNTWTWMGGTNLVNQQGVYGLKNVPAAGNVPGSRFSAACWTDKTGNLWLFGGTGYATNIVPGRLNDMFMYNIATNEWSWEHGMNTNNMNGIYGTMTIPAPFTTPGARYYNTWWPTAGGSMWLFGGLGFGATGFSPNNMNDLWKFKPPCTPVSLNTAAQLTGCNGVNFTLTALSNAAGTLHWYNSPTSTTSIATGSILVTPSLTASGSATTYTYYVDVAGCPNLTAVTLTVNTTPTVSISTDNNLICAGTTVSLTANGANTYTWNTSATGSVIAISPSVTTTYSVIGLDTNGCKNTAQLTQSVSLCTNINSINTAEWVNPVLPNPSSGEFTITSTMDGASFVLFNQLGMIIIEERLRKGENSISTKIAAGCYNYTIKSDGTIIKDGKLIIQ